MLNLEQDGLVELIFKLHTNSQKLFHDVLFHF